MPNDFVIAKLDFCNAFHSVRRNIMLKAVADHLPQLYRFCYLAYCQPSLLMFGHHVIPSEERAPPGDPLGPLLFCLAIQPLYQSLSSLLACAYSDDVTVGRPARMFVADVHKIANLGPSYELRLNTAQCEAISKKG
jgi:Reverse transcriptase (RNA-dependent DNA polymerase)